MSRPVGAGSGEGISGLRRWARWSPGGDAAGCRRVGVQTMSDIAVACSDGVTVDVDVNGGPPTSSSCRRSWRHVDRSGRAVGPDREGSLVLTIVNSSTDYTDLGALTTSRARGPRPRGRRGTRGRATRDQCVRVAPGSTGPRSSATPCSVTTLSTVFFRVVTTEPSLRRGTMRDRPAGSRRRQHEEALSAVGVHRAPSEVRLPAGAGPVLPGDRLRCGLTEQVDLGRGVDRHEARVPGR